MKKPTKSRREKLSVPHRCTWEDDFRKRLAGLEEPRNALRQLIQKGCLEESLLDLVYAYIVSPALVFRVQKEARERVLKGLERVVKLLDRASANMQETLDLGMLEGWNLGRLLRERALFKIPDGSARSVPAFPDFALSMGETLRLHSKHLRSAGQKLTLFGRTENVCRGGFTYNSVVDCNRTSFECSPT
jgi:hypothetical protein